MTEAQKPNLLDRAGSLWRAARSSFAGRLAKRRHVATLAALGEELVASQQAPDCAAYQNVATAEERIRVLRAELDGSLAQDRRDYAAVPRWMKTVVILRGLFARAVVRAHLRAALRELRQSHGDLGAMAIGDPLRGRAVELAEEARAAETAARLTAEEHERHLASAGFSPPPPLLARAGRELAVLSKVAAAETKSHVVPRVPGLVGLAAGWWLANTFTDSQLSATLHGWGIGSGPSRSLDPDTYRRLAFWLPIGAGALASYLGMRVTAFLRARYGTQTPQA